MALTQNKPRPIKAKGRFITDKELQLIIKREWAKLDVILAERNEARARELAESMGEAIGLALVASSAACADSNKDTELFLRNVARRTLELLPSVGNLAQVAAFIWADMLMESEPRFGMCPAMEIRAH